MHSKFDALLYNSCLIRAVKGDMENGLFFCGTSAEKIHEIIDVHTLMDQLKGEVKEQ